MNYQKFLEQLPTFYENWGHEGVCPKFDFFQNVLHQVQGMTTANVMQLLNFAVECMEPGEVYCEIGCFQGASLIGALLDHPECMAYAVDDFSKFNALADPVNKLMENLEGFSLADQVYYCCQNFEDFFVDLQYLEAKDKIGVYFYNGDRDYRSTLMSLLLSRVFLAEQAIIVVGGSNSKAVRQAIWDFVAANPYTQVLLEPQTKLFGDYSFWIGVQVLGWDVYKSHSYPSSFFHDVRDRSVIKSIYALQDEENKEVINSLYKEAVLLDCSESVAAGLAIGKTYTPEFLQQTRKQLIEAEQKYKQVLQWDENNAEVWLRLGKLYYVIEQYQESLEMLLKSLELNPTGAIQYYIGLLMERVGETSQAVQAYQEAILLEPKLVDAYNNMGNILLASGKIEQAELLFRQGNVANPEHFGSYLNLGNALMAQQRLEEAITAYKIALKLSPKNSDVLNNLSVALKSKNEHGQALLYSGDAFYFQGKYEEAVLAYQKFLEIQTGDGDFYCRMAKCYESLNQSEEAIKVYREGIERHPNTFNLYSSLVQCFQAFRSTQESIKIADEASQLLPENLYFKLQKYLALPFVYNDHKEIYSYRIRFVQGLEAVIQQTSLDNSETVNGALRGIGSHTNFALQYQGYNDLELQKKYGQFVHQIMANRYPEWVEYKAMPRLSQDEKIRIGYISDSMRSDGVGKVYLSWLRNSDRQKFELYCYYTYSVRDQLTHHFQAYSDVFYHIPNNLEAVCRQILNDQLHILVFPDIGMNPLLTQIAGLRLAPVQCTTWVHPVTSGLPTIDYFLSGDLMEPENAQEHYSEQLIRLPNIGFSYAKPSIPEVIKSRSDFRLAEDAVVYISCQSLSKYLPQYDYIFPKIAQRVSSAQFVFIASHIGSHITEQFRQRLQRAFANFGLSMKDHCVILPRQYTIAYLNLMLTSDVFLDTFRYSGALTTFDAIACDLPIVTCPSELMRGRQSYAFLKMLGVTETIAKDEAEYIEIAVRLGLDLTWRNSVIQRMRQHHASLYNDQNWVPALEKFYQRVVRGNFE